MTQVLTRNVTWISRNRRHRTNCAVDINRPVTNNVERDSVYHANAFPEIAFTDSSGRHTEVFAFWSVLGPGGSSFLSTDPDLSIRIEDTDVAATAWYLPQGEPGQPIGPGVLIDAFDIDLGTFVDDDFVTVSPDAALTAAANNEGFVPTRSLEHVMASSTAHAAPFDHWIVATGPETAAQRDLTATQAANGIAFALYRTLAPSRLSPPPLWNWVSWGVMVDGGGPTGHGPVPPWSPLVREFAAGLALAHAGFLGPPEMRSRVFHLAAEQIDSTAGKIAASLKSQK